MKRRIENFHYVLYVKNIVKLFMIRSSAANVHSNFNIKLSPCSDSKGKLLQSSNVAWHIAFIYNKFFSKINFYILFCIERCKREVCLSAVRDISGPPQTQVH